MPSRLCHVALVGRPNVGKSTLFNRLVGSRLAVVSDEAGTTRDRLERVIEHNGTSFAVFDLAGIEPNLENTELTAAVQAQVTRSLERADILLWVVDARAGSGPLDDQVSRILRQLRRPVIIAANKCDDPKHDIGQFEFSQYGFGETVALSAVHGRGIHDLLEQVTARVQEWEKNQDQEGEPDAADLDRELRIALIGRPNVGKSTLLNRLVGEIRSVVSAEAGTTRDAVDTVVPATDLFGSTYTRWRTVRLVDTAGIRRRGKIGHEVEAWSVLRTMDAIDQAEVVLFVIDGEQGLVHQDLQVVERAVEAGRALILLVNKWDAILAAKKIYPGTPEEQELQEKVLDTLRRQAPFLHWAHVLFLSALEGTNVHIIGRLVLNAFQSWNLRVEQSDLDELAVVLRRMPRLRNLQTIVMEHNRPPVFHVMIEGKELPHFSTHRFIENALRDRFSIGSTPIKIWSVPSVAKRKTRS